MPEAVFFILPCPLGFAGKVEKEPPAKAGGSVVTTVYWPRAADEDISRVQGSGESVTRLVPKGRKRVL